MSKFIKIILALTFVSALCAIILTFTYNNTKDAIALEYRLDFLASLKAVLPDYNNYPDEDIILINDKEVYEAKKDGQTVGYGIAFSSNKGYGGTVNIIVGVDTIGRVSGVFVLQHKETPGLGDKITDVAFLSLFKGLSDPNMIAVKKDGGIIDQFSGATMSPRAVAEAVREALNFLHNNVILVRKDETN